MKYAQIVFYEFNDPEGITFDDFYDMSTEEKVNYLAQWDYGEYHDLREESMAGSDDTVKRVGDYILSYNWDLEYAGLQRVIEG